MVKSLQLDARLSTRLGSIYTHVRIILCLVSQSGTFTTLAEEINTRPATVFLEWGGTETSSLAIILRQ